MRTPEEEKARIEAALERGWALIDRLDAEGKHDEANKALDAWIALSERHRAHCEAYQLYDRPSAA